MLAAFLLHNAIGFDSPDELPVRLMFFLLVPEASTQRHLEILSNIASLLSQGEIRSGLLLSQDAQELHSKIVQGSLSLSS